MTKALKVLDGAALTLTGVGLIGGALASIDVLGAPAGVLCATALAIGVTACAVVRKLAPAAEAMVADEHQDDGVAGAHPDPLRIKTVVTDPGDPTVPGTPAWNATWMPGSGPL